MTRTNCIDRKTRQNTQLRLSNIELLRIFSMLLIVSGHTYLRLKPIPALETVNDNLLLSFFDILSRVVSVGGVGIFVSISGWFGIRYSKKGLMKYLFMVLFLLWGIYGMAIAFGMTKFDIYGIKTSMTFYEGYWFVSSYLALYLISPVLNSFIENAPKKQIERVLIFYYLFQSYYSWISYWYDYYNGYSIILFAGIYMTAAYLRKYPVEWLEKHSIKLLCGITVGISLITLFSLWKFGHAARQIRDDNPLVILTCILFLLCFKKLKFQSRFVNWMAASCFAVYLIHFNPSVYPYLMKFMRMLYFTYDGIEYIVVLLIALVLIYFICALIDQVRILFWNMLQRLTSLSLTRI